MSPSRSLRTPEYYGRFSYESVYLRVKEYQCDYRLRPTLLSFGGLMLPRRYLCSNTLERFSYCVILLCIFNHVENNLMNYEVGVLIPTNRNTAIWSMPS